MIPMQAVLFIVIGLVLTAVDVTLFRLIFCGARWNRYAANLVSTSVVLTISLLANRNIVFRPDHFEYGPGIMRFLAISLTSAWGIQNGMLWLLANWEPGAQILRKCVETVTGRTGRELGILSGVTLHKLAACGSGMVWNFCWYRWWVFV